MDSLPPEQVARLIVIAYGVFTAVLALFAWRTPGSARAWGAAMGLSVAAYGQCTAGVSGNAGSAFPAFSFVLVFFCAALPAVFWSFVQVLFGDSQEPEWLRVTVVATVGLLGVMSLDVTGLPDPLSGMLAVLRRLTAVGLVLHSLWALARGFSTDLVSERLSTRRWVISIAGLYVLVILVIEVFVSEQSISATVQTANLAAIALICLAAGVALTRWDLRVVVRSRTSDTTSNKTKATEEPPLRLPVAPLAQSDLIGDDGALIVRLEAAMTSEQLYREERLTIAGLASRLNTQEHRLRRAINQQMGFRNYNEFLHHYRLADAAQHLRDPAQASTPVLTIALESGYASIGPFNRAFKARFGQTPTEFRRSVNSP